jgi:sulfur-oxidizing protein SoxZ
MAEILRTTRIVCPERATPGQVITIKTLIQHPMETGFRRNDTGGAIPRDIIEHMVVTYDGVEIFRARLYTGIAANPYFQFTTTATATGRLAFTWTDMAGNTTTETRTMTVA